MAAVTGTSSAYSVAAGGGNREDLEDKIHDLYPDDSFAQQNFDKVSASAVLHEWLGDSLAAPGSNINIEGDDATFATIANPSRYTNHCQIVKKTFVISGTQEVVNKAGRKKESGRQAVKKMREAKNDLEYALVRNQAATVGSATVGRSLGSMESWIGDATASATVAGQVILATTSAGATTAPLSSGAPAAPTDGTTTGALTEAAIKLALEGAWQEGGDVDTILVSAGVKEDINAFSGVATRQVDVARGAQASITGAADFYVSSFGTHKVKLHRHVRTSVALCVDSGLWAIATLRPWVMEKLAKTGDAEKWQILCEKTLVCRNYKGNAKVVAIA